MRVGAAALVHGCACAEVDAIVAERGAHDDLEAGIGHVCAHGHGCGHDRGLGGHGRGRRRGLGGRVVDDGQGVGGVRHSRRRVVGENGNAVVLATPAIRAVVVADRVVRLALLGAVPFAVAVDALVRRERSAGLAHAFDERAVDAGAECLVCRAVLAAAQGHLLLVALAVGALFVVARAGRGVFHVVVLFVV